MYDYEGMDDETAALLRARTHAIRERVNRAAQDILEIGRMLIEVKQRLGHGQFGAWLRAEFAWSHQTAVNYMHVAERLPDIHNGLDFAPRALYMLAAPSAPAAARVEAVQRATAGEVITPSKAKEIVRSHKDTPPRAYGSRGPAPPYVPPPRPAHTDRLLLAKYQVLQAAVTLLRAELGGIDAAPPSDATVAAARLLLDAPLLSGAAAMLTGDV